MRETLGTIRGRFDYVFIDTPPAIAVSDAAVLSSLCDGILLVLNVRQTTTRTAQTLTERLQASNPPILGVVLNAVDYRSPEYSVYRYYYKSYYNSVEETADAQGQMENGGDGTDTDGVVVLDEEVDGIVSPKILERWTDVPVIVMTGYADIDNAVEVLKIGAGDYIVKPFGAEAIRESTQAMLKKQGCFATIRQLRRQLDLPPFTGPLRM